MLKITDLREWRYNPDNGDLEFRLGFSDGNMREVSIDRAIAAVFMTHINRLLSMSMDEFPSGLKEMAEAHTMKSVTTIILPNGQPALEITTQVDSTHTFPLNHSAAQGIRGALLDAESNLQASESAQRH